MKEIKQAVDSLAYAFEEFKSANDERIDSLEKKGRTDVLVDEKVSRLNNEIDRGYDRLRKMELALKRPQFATENGMLSVEDQEQKAAFISYIRKGETTALQGLHAKSLSAGVDADGGYLMPQVVADQLGRNLEILSPVRELASVMTISSAAVELLLDKDGAEAGWVSETDVRPETGTPNLMKIRIPVHELYAKPRATQKLMDDARINVDQWLSEKLGSKLAQMENHAFIHGDGTNKPKGFLNYETAGASSWTWGKLEHIATGTAGAFDEEAGADALIDAVNALNAEYQKGAVWLMSRTAHAAVRKLKDQNGSYLWQPAMGLDAAPSLMGYKVVISEDMPALVAGTASNSIVFGNFKEGYQIVDRAGTRIMRDPYSAKPYVEFYTTKRLGGDVVNFRALKVVKFA